MSRRSSTGSERASAAPGRVLHLDAFSGIAGNMLLGALLDLGLPLRALEADLAPLGLAFEIEVRRVRRGALAARYVDVRAPRGRPPRAGARARAHRNPHLHRRDPIPHAPGRRWLEIRRLLERAALAPPVRERALAIFEALADAEARVHGIAIDAVHFHEVGAIDAIVDITGAAAGLHRLG